MRLLAAVLAASIAGACGSPPATSLPPATVAPVQPSILVSDGGVLRPVSNGGRVALRSGWASVHFSSLNADHIDLDVAVFDARGQTIAAAVAASYSMLDMDHGVLQAKGAARDGAYRVPIDIPMPGAWKVVLRVTRGASDDAVTLVLPQVGY